MLKKLLIALILLTGSANASFFEALKDAAAKAIEEQNRLNSAVEGNSPATSDQKSAPKFNSLAEEEAYKKRQEEEKVTDAKKYEQELRTTLIPRIQRLRTAEASFYQKYLVKQNDKQETIDNKFKNRTQLYQDLQRDFSELDTEREKLYTILENNKFNDVQSKVINESFKEKTWYAELSSIFSNAAPGSSSDYVVTCYSGSDGISIDLRMNWKFKDIDSYADYLKCTYTTYQKRQDEVALQIKRDQMQQNQKSKIANEQKERQKVQSACQAWRAKANKGVYALGIGDKVMSKNGGSYIIQGVNANTFLVNWMGNSMYLQKSDLVPYDSLRMAPSEYCYR